MPSETFDLVYHGNTKYAETAIDRLIKKIEGLDKTVDASVAKFATLGSNAPGLAALISTLQQAQAALAAVGSQTGQTQSAIGSIGSNVSGLNKVSQSLTAIQQTLSQITAQANAAHAAMSAIPAAGGGAGAPPAPGAGGVAGAAAGIPHPGAFVLRQGANLLRAAGNAAGQAGKEERDAHAEAAAKAAAFRDHLRETATLAGKQGIVDDELISQQLDFQQKTAMHAEEATTFSNQFEGAIESGKKRGNINNKTAAALKQQAAVFTVRTEMDAETGGKLAGLLGEYGKVESAEQGMNQLGQIQHHLNVLGVGSMRQLGRPFLGLMGEMVNEDGGRVKDPVELSAMFAASTVRAKRPDVAATNIRQANRVLRKMAIQGVAGVTPEDDYMSALRKVAPKITGAGGDLWLRQNGFGNDAENQGLIKQAQLIPVVEAAMKDERAKVSGGKALAANNEFLRSSVGRARVAENKAYASEVLMGMGSERVQLLRTQAEARLRNAGKIDTADTGMIDWVTGNMSGPLSGVSGRDERIDKELIRERLARAKELGIPNVDERFGHIDAKTGPLRMFNQLNPFVKGAPGGLMGIDKERREGIAKLDKEIEAKEREILKKQEEIAEKNRQAAAMQLQAAQLQVQNAGGGGGALPRIVQPGR